jgi:hypothetical protein
MKYLRPTNNPTQHIIVNYDPLNILLLWYPLNKTTHRRTFLGVSCVFNLSCTFGGPQTNTATTQCPISLLQGSFVGGNKAKYISITRSSKKYLYFLELLALKVCIRTA